ncbi:MAG: retropepsin-like domain-containing protein [Candidatus Thiodiazotropha endolucinida]|nr:retropepsin-like domain-containing protein [Candidatus Thiodiazotropha taylori]
MEGTIRKTIKFSESSNLSNPSPARSSEALRFSGDYSEYMANLFGELQINPVGFSTPGPGVTIEGPPSGGSYQSTQSSGMINKTLQLDLSGDTLMMSNETPQPQTPRGITPGVGLLNPNEQLSLSAGTMRQINETYQVQTNRIECPEIGSNVHQLSSPVVQGETYPISVNEVEMPINQDIPETYTPVSRKTTHFANQAELSSCHDPAIQFTRGQITESVTNQRPFIATGLHQSTADSLLQPCTVAYNFSVPQMSSNRLSQGNISLNIGQNPSNNYQQYNGELMTQAANISATCSNAPYIGTQLIDMPISIRPSEIQTETTPILQGSTNQIYTTPNVQGKYFQNASDYASLQWQQDQLQKQLAQQLIKDQEEKLLKQQQQLKEIFQQQQQQWQQLQQQKHTLFSAKNDQSEVITQRLPQQQSHYVQPVYDYDKQVDENNSKLSNRQSGSINATGFGNHLIQTQSLPLYANHSSTHMPATTVPNVSLQLDRKSWQNADHIIKGSQYPTPVPGNYANINRLSHQTQIQSPANTESVGLPFHLSEKNIPSVMPREPPVSQEQMCNLQDTCQLQDIHMNHTTNTEQQHPQITSRTHRKEIQPDNFDGSDKTEWPDYIIHFEQCAAWNQWADAQKAQMLAIHLRGEAQRLLSSLTQAQLTDYNRLKSILSDRYDPREKEVTYRCQFRHYRREKGVSVSDFGYNLSKLAQKAYPNLTMAQLEVHVIDQFINGLGHHDLQKHVQFRHPQSLHQAIGLATEYEALEGTIDRVKKPSNELTTVAPIANTNDTENKEATCITLEQISKLIDKKLSTILPNNNIRDNSSVRQRDISAPRQRERSIERSFEPKSPTKSPNRSRRNLYCAYCKRTNHTIDECYSRQRKNKNVNEKDKDEKSAYVITPPDETNSRIIPTITITPAVDIVSADDTNRDYQTISNKHITENVKNENAPVGQKKSSSDNDPTSVSNLQNDSEEIRVNTSVSTCLYLQANAFNQNSKFLLDTGSPYSILSKQIFDRLQGEEQIPLNSDSPKLRAADGSLIKTSGKLVVPLQINDKLFSQEFIVAKIHGIDGIVGMDFLCHYDGKISIRKQHLKTNKGKVKLFKQNSDTCARVQIANTTVIQPNSEAFIKGKIDQPCIKNELLSIAEPTKFLTNKGCFIARTLVDPNQEDIVVSILNLSDESVKVNQHSVIGVLQEAEEIYKTNKTECPNENKNQPVPTHLQSLIQNASDKLTPNEKQSLTV